MDDRTPEDGMIEAKRQLDSIDLPQGMEAGFQWQSFGILDCVMRMHSRAGWVITKCSSAEWMKQDFDMTGYMESCRDRVAVLVEKYGEAPKRYFEIEGRQVLTYLQPDGEWSPTPPDKTVEPEDCDV